MADYDIRQIPVRLVGYSMALGEALKFSFPNIKFISFCRGITIGYAIFDMMHQTKRVKRYGTKAVFIEATDVFLWQTAASIIFPTLAVNQVCWITRICTLNFRKSTANLLTSSIGISILPSFIQPFDEFTNFVLDGTFRKYVKQYFLQKEKVDELKKVENVSSNELSISQKKIEDS